MTWRSYEPDDDVVFEFRRARVSRVVMYILSWVVKSGP